MEEAVRTRDLNLCLCEHCVEIRKQQDRANTWRMEDKQWDSQTGSFTPQQSMKSLN